MFQRLFALILLALIAASSFAQEQAKWRAYFGTYTNDKSEGIYAADFDPTSGKFGEPKLAAKITSPSFLAISADFKRLYCVNEISNFEGKKAGGITAFSIEGDGSLKQLNQQPSIGAGPCHLTLDRTGKFVYAANYGGGSVCGYSIAADGSLGEKVAFVQHTGSGANPARQKEPHAHSINVSSDNRFAFCADLGIDKIMIYKIDPKSGALAANDPPAGIAPPGGGPRHFAFHPSGKWAYSNNELTSGVSSYDYDSERGSLTLKQTLSTLPSGFSGNNSTAETVAHPNGKFVFVSNRGHNSVAIFAVNEKTGELTAMGHASEGINVPRNFALDPTGNHLVVGNQADHSVVTFRFDPETGTTKSSGVKISVGNPVCIRFAKY